MPKTGPPHQNGSMRWKYALLGGFTSLPFTTLSYWQTGSELSFGAVLFGGLLAGYLYNRAGGEDTGVGIRVGVIGGLPVLWVLFDILTATDGLSGPAWFVASGTLLAVGFSLVVAVLGFGLAALIGEIGARVGGWFAGNPRQAATAPDP